jgi:hypothetical protein
MGSFGFGFLLPILGSLALQGILLIGIVYIGARLAIRHELRRSR